MARILIADDDPILRELVRYRLEQDGHETVSAADGAAALERTRAGDIDLVVLDSMMPVVSGPAVLAELKGNPATSAIPVVMLTARKDDGDVVAALEGGAGEYITKPFIPKELLARITRLLSPPR